jgi:integrase
MSSSSSESDSDPLDLRHGADVLLANTIAPATRVAYNRAVRKFLTFTRITLDSLLRRSARRIDRMLTDYLHHLHRTRSPHCHAVHAVYGLIYHAPELKERLLLSRRSLRGWDRTRTHRSHPPLTWELTVMLALTMARRGLHAEAAASLLAFDCYLRIGEYLRLQFADVAQLDDPRLGASHTGMALRLAHTKTGPNQWVSVRHSAVAAVFTQHLQSRRWSPTDLVFPFSRSHWRRVLRSCCSDLGLGHIPFVPHSFRHGGATRDFIRGVSIEQIKLHGRWKSLESARRYIQQGPALLLLNSVPTRLVQQALLFEPHVAQCLTYLRDTVPTAAPVRGRTVRFH